MRATFDEGWSYRRKQNMFLGLSGGGEAWKPVRLPHDAMLDAPRRPDAPSASGYYTGGVWEYTKTFSVPDGWRDQCVALNFEGAYRTAQVYVNDDLSGHRASGYSEFTVELDPYLRFGADNTVRVEVRADDDSRWYSGAGLYRNVHLVVRPLAHLVLDGVTITTPDVSPDLAVVVVATQVRNSSRVPTTVTVTSELRDEHDSVVAAETVPLTVRSGEVATARQRIPVPTPRLWSVDEPNLYTCRSSVVGDAEHVSSTTFGIRRLQLDPVHGLRVNGATVKLRGACVHHDNGVLGAATIGRADERRVELLKAAGFNALRSAHQPMSRAMLDACDRRGVLVIDEAFDMWTEPKRDHDYALDFPEWWERDLESMVRKDINHPCVVMYSVGNEIPEVGSALGAARARDLAEKVRALDPNRYVTSGVQPLLAVRGILAALAQQAGARRDDEVTEADVNGQMAAWDALRNRLFGLPLIAERTAEAFASTDVAGYNYLDVRYELDRDLFPNRVIVGSETYPGNIDVNWRLVMANPHVIGDFTWTGWDYLGEAGIGRVQYAEEHLSPPARGDVTGPFPWMTAGCGDIDITGHRLPQSYYREIVFGLRDEPYLAVHRPQHHGEQVVFSGPWSWTDSISSWSWAGHEGSPVTVDVYSATDEVELLVNGASLGRRPSGPAHRFTATFETSYEPGELTAVAYTAGIEVGRTSLRSAAGGSRLDLEVDRAVITTTVDDLAFVAITLVDERGTVATHPDRLVTVEVSGPGVLQGLGSGDPRGAAATSFDGTTPTYDGRALAVVRPTGAGRIVITGTTEGCPPASVHVDATA